MGQSLVGINAQGCSPDEWESTASLSRDFRPGFCGAALGFDKSAARGIDVGITHTDVLVDVLA
jgi:hypothetical protein